MKLHLNTSEQRFLIQGYSATHIAINGERHTQSLILTPERRMDWAVQHAQSLDDALLSLLLTDAPEVIVIGCGATQRVPSPTVLRFFARHGVGLEYVSTPAACRVYNILASEGRRVGCGLILGDEP